MTDFDSVYEMDAFDLLRGLPDGSVDAVITDPPYLTTQLSFDKLAIDWAALITECLRVVKPTGAVVLFAAMRTAVAMISAAPKYYRYDWVWTKTKPTGFPSAPLQPLRAHEHILVWSTGVAINGFIAQQHKPMCYNPVMGKGAPYLKFNRKGSNRGGGMYSASATDNDTTSISNGERYPTSVVHYPNPNNGSLHPTQKPLDLMTYLVKTYTLAGEVIVDPFAGSGTTLRAAQLLGRRYIGCDLSAEYVDIARRRLAEPFTLPMFAEDETDIDALAQMGLL